MLHVFYVILEYRTDYRNFLTAKWLGHSLCTACAFCTLAISNQTQTRSSLFISTIPVAVYNRARVLNSTDAKLIQGDRNNVFVDFKYIHKQRNYSTHICRIKGCGGAGWPPPPIIFERLKLPQQIIYRRKENLSESPNHQKYWENILVSRFYEQFSRNRRNLGHFRKFEKISNS